MSVYTRFQKTLRTFLIFIFVAVSVNAATYYSQTTGNFDGTDVWDTQSDGLGTDYTATDEWVGHEGEVATWNGSSYTFEVINEKITHKRFRTSTNETDVYGSIKDKLWSKVWTPPYGIIASGGGSTQYSIASNFLFQFFFKFIVVKKSIKRFISIKT